MSEELKPYQPVMVRDTEVGEWTCSFFSHIRKYENGKTAYICINETTWNYCLPYNNETKHLIGTTDSPTPPEPEFKWGDKVEVKVEESHEWIRAIFCWEESSTYYCMIYPSSCCLWKYCRHSNW